MASRVLVFSSSDASPQMDKFVSATVEALSLMHPEVELQDLGVDAPNDYFRSHAWRRTAAPWTTVEHFTDRSVPANWMEVRGDDLADVLRLESLLRPTLPFEPPASLLESLQHDSTNASLLVRTALAHVGLDVPEPLSEAIDRALRSADLELFTAGCTAASLLPDERFVPMVTERGRTDSTLQRLVESTLEHLNAHGRSG